MKILHVISQRPDSTGSGIYLRQLVARAAAADHENSLVCGLGPEDTASLDGINDAWIRAVHFESADTPGRIIGMSDAMPYPSRTFRSLDEDALHNYRTSFTSAITDAANQFEPDIIHTHHLWIVTALTRELFSDTPILTSCHGSELRQFMQCPDLRRYVSDGCGRIDRVCALSAPQKEQIARTYPIDPDRIIVTGAGFDGEIFYPPASVQRESGDPFRILYTGKLSRAKGVVWLLRALHALQKRADRSFHLHLAGSGHGPEYEACVQAAVPLDSHVTFHGSVPQRELAELMRQCDLLVLPSLSEGLPLVILEALACGCRIIATDLPGVREIAAHIDPGLLQMIPTPDVTDINSTALEDEHAFVRDLRQALHTVLSGPLPGARTGNAHTGLEHFTWESVYRRIEPMWYELLAGSDG